MNEEELIQAFNLRGPPEPPIVVCSRKACQAVLDGPHMAIWNQGTDCDPRLYCVSCGRKIIDYNQEFDELKLRFEWRKA